MSKLKIITTTSTPLYLYNTINGPQLRYKDSGGNVIRLNKGGGTPKYKLLTCSGLKTILSKYFMKGIKFIISTYNPVLYYLFPGDPTYDALFKPETKFIPTLTNLSSLIRGEVNGFDKSGFSRDSTITQSSVRSIKACDSWYNSPSEEANAITAINERVKEVFGYYADFNEIDIEKEVRDKLGDYSSDLSTNSQVVDLMSGTEYTDTINISDWVYASGKKSVKAKLDISFMYSKGGNVFCGSQSLDAFYYNEMYPDLFLIHKDQIIRLGDIQIEYVNYVLKIYPISNEISEVIFNDCIMTIGNL